MLNSIVEIVMEDHNFLPLHNNCIEMEQIGYFKQCSAEEAAEVISQLDSVPCVNTYDSYQYTAAYAHDGTVEIKVYWPEDKQAWWVPAGAEKSSD